MANWKDDAFVQYLMEENKDKRYKTATEAGYEDADGDFLVGDSGGFLLNAGHFKFTNVHLLREVAEHYETHGVYTKEKPGTMAYDRFRRREEFRRKNGFSAYCKDVNGNTELLRITGDLYNFINYGQILKLDTKSIKKDSKSASKIYGIPEFFGFQYWYTKVLEFARNNNYHTLMLKPRRSGITYIESASNANIVNLIPKVTVINAAYDKKYLTKGDGITTMAKTQLDYYETDTPFNRGYLSEDPEDLELGYKPAGSNMRKGYRSKLVTVSFGKDAMAAAGKDAYKISVEELSNAQNLKDFLDLTVPTTRTSSFTTGLLNGWGTGGANDANWEAFEDCFYAPGTYYFMPFENVWEGDKRDTVCGFFKSYIESLQGIDIDKESPTYGKSSMDINGNTDYETAYNIIMHDRKLAKATKPTKEYLKDIGQFCLKPSEAFTNTGDNMFTTPELIEHVKRVMTDESMHTYHDGTVIDDDGIIKFMTNDELRAKGRSNQAHEYLEDVPFKTDGDIYGCVRMYQRPLKGANGTIPSNLYRVWHDPFGVEKTADQVTNQNSLTSIIVYMRVNNETADMGDKIVATYRGRPDSHFKVNKLMYNIARYYNARIQFENDRGQVASDFKNHFNATFLLEKEPNAAWDTTLTAKHKQGFGMTLGAGTSNRSLKALDYLHQWLYTIRGYGEDESPIYNFHFIKDIPILLELLKFAPKRNLDSISALKIGMFDMKEILTLPIKTILNNKKGDSKNPFNRNWF